MDEEGCAVAEYPPVPETKMPPFPWGWKKYCTMKAPGPNIKNQKNTLEDAPTVPCPPQRWLPQT